jgi:Helix-turn-helix domain
MAALPRSQLIPACWGNPMNMMVPAPVPPGCAREDLMTRRQVASLFRVTSAAVASWARRGRLPEVRDEAGKPRYRRADVEMLFRNGTKWRAR